VRRLGLLDTNKNRKNRKNGGKVEENDREK